MKTLDKRIKKGTKVQEISGDWYKIEIIHETGGWFKVRGFMGWWQAGHIVKFSNKRTQNETR